ncbi:MAG: hypothetical protein CMJ31_07950 [Phycisphaerae bacterium]|nr:hypothetical protein [Phycisphaerae bacterium]
MASFASVLFGRALPAVAILAASGVAAMFGLELIRSRTEAAVYRERVETLTSDYEQLRSRFNDAAKRTAVTELVVENGDLSVVVRTDVGAIRRIETPYDPSREIYVDFALVEGRVWIRRVFDANTPPMFATLIDPDLETIDWEDEGARFGQAVYRSLGEGRWVVTVSGSGALQLARAPGDAPTALAPPPEVVPFDEIEAEARREASGVTWRDFFERLVQP